MRYVSTRGAWAQSPRPFREILLEGLADIQRVAPRHVELAVAEMKHGYPLIDQGLDFFDQVGKGFAEDPVALCHGIDAIAAWPVAPSLGLQAHHTPCLEIVEVVHGASRGEEVLVHRGRAWRIRSDAVPFPPHQARDSPVGILIVEGGQQVEEVSFLRAGDPEAPVEVSDRFAQLHPGLVRYVRTEGDGHAASWNTDPARYQTALAAFLDEVAAGPAPGLEAGPDEG